MKKRITSILLALVLCLGLLPTSVLADEPTEYPFTPSIGEITECVKGGYTYYGMVYAPEDPAADEWGYIYPMNTADLYTVTVPYGEIDATEETLTFLEERIAYGYDAYGGYLNSCAADAVNGYGNNGQDGELTANVRLIDDFFADYIVVQTPYDEFWSSTTLYAIRFEYTTENPAEKAKKNLHWSDLSNETRNAVKNDLTLLLSDAETGTAISWSSSAPSVVSTNGTVTRPAYGSGDAAVLLTATLTYELDEDTKVFSFTVPAVSGSEFNDSRLNELLSEIAAGYVDDSSEWVVMDMAAYAGYCGDAAQQTSAEAKQKYINSAVTSVSDSAANDTDYAKAILALRALGKDPQQLYTVNSNTPINVIRCLNSVTKSASAWSAPYTLAAYNQGSYDTDSYEEELLSAVLAKQQDDGSWDEYGTIDTTGNVLAALAFYKGSTEVDAAIDKAIAYLSSQQKDNGAFDDGQTSTWAAGINANSTAMAIIGLAANGVDPAADPRFIKNGNSALDGLLSFALTDNSGFGYTDNSSLNGYATEQGFRALIAAAQAIKNGSAYNVYDFSANAADPAHAIGAKGTTTPTSPTGDTIKVYVTIKGDTGDYWLKRYAVMLPGEGATVYHAFTAACEANGITQTGAESGYVRSIEKSGKSLSEYDNGADSGWLYRVEGHDFPEVGLTEFAIENGDSIIWYYTNDWTVDRYAGSMVTKTETAFVTPTATAVNGEAKAEVSVKNVSSAIAAAKADGAKEIVIAPVVKGSAGKVSVELPKTAVNDIVESSDAALNIQTDVGSIDIPNDTLSEILKAAGSTDIAMSVETVATETVADKLPETVSTEGAVAVNFTITSGENTITSFGGKALEVQVPVDTKQYDEGKTYTAFVVSDDDSVEQTTATISDGSANVTMYHFSTVVITKEETSPFTDVRTGAYYYDAVLWAAGNGVTAGTDDTHFSPNRPCTRAQVVTFLWRAAGCPKAEGKTPFTDVAADTYYSDAVTWAYEQGITGGTSATTFSPNTAVTRAQVVTFLYRYEKPAAGTAVNPFADVQKNAYYYDAVQWAYADGVTDGTDETHFSPNTVCTRGQIVTFLYRDFDSELSESSGVEMRLAEAAAYVLKTTPAPRFGSVGGEWAVLGLARSGSAVPESYYADYYTALEKTVSEAKGVLSTRKYTEYSRVIVALAAIGIDARNVAGYDLTVPLGDYDNTVKQGTSGPVWALIALDSRNYPMPICPDAATSATRQMYIDRLLATQNTDGGWGIGTESASDVDMTAMALQVLAKYQEQKAAADATERALAFLGGKQDENGGYASSESTAQVIVALCSLGIDLGDIRFIKNGHTLLDDLESYRVSGGGYRHTRDGEVNQMASEQALYALAAVQRAQTGMPGLYRMEQ